MEEAATWLVAIVLLIVIIAYAAALASPLIIAYFVGRKLHPYIFERHEHGPRSKTVLAGVAFVSLMAGISVFNQAQQSARSDDFVAQIAGFTGSVGTGVVLFYVASGIVCWFWRESALREVNGILSRARENATAASTRLGTIQQKKSELEMEKEELERSHGHSLARMNELQQGVNEWCAQEAANRTIVIQKLIREVEGLKGDALLRRERHARDVAGEEGKEAAGLERHVVALREEGTKIRSTLEKLDREINDYVGIDPANLRLRVAQLERTLPAATILNPLEAKSDLDRLLVQKEELRRMLDLLQGQIEESMESANEHRTRSARARAEADICELQRLARLVDQPRARLQAIERQLASVDLDLRAEEADHNKVVAEAKRLEAIVSQTAQQKVALQ